MGKMRMMLSCGLLCITVLLVLVISIHAGEKNAGNTIADYKAFAQKNISEIRLREAGDSIICVAFSDADLINMWTSYLNAADFKYVKKEDFSRFNGGMKTIDLFSGTDKISFQTYSEGETTYIVIKNFVFAANHPTSLPYDKSYSIATQRGYIQPTV